MSKSMDRLEWLPETADVLTAITLYLKEAYGRTVPTHILALLPAADCDVADWLMSDVVERDPANAPLSVVRSFALRLGNSQYPHMKLRLSRPPRDKVFLFSIDSHDAFLRALPESPDYEPLEQLKRHNASVAADITAAWNKAGLPTHANYLRQKIGQTRQLHDTGLPSDIPPESSSRPPLT